MHYYPLSICSTTTSIVVGCSKKSGRPSDECEHPSLFMGSGCRKRGMTTLWILSRLLKKGTLASFDRSRTAIVGSLHKPILFLL